MKKEDFIKKAWLEVNFEPEKTDDNGYVDYYSLPEDFPLYGFDFIHGPVTEKPRSSIVRPKTLAGIEFYSHFNNTWINIQKELPPFGKRVIFRTVISWRSEKKFKYFDDELTTEEETLEYGINSYLLKENTDYVVCQHKDISNLYDEYVTHWMEIPEF